MSSKPKIEGLDIYREIFNKLNAVIIVHDARGNILEANERTLDSLGYKEGELSSLNLMDLLREEERAGYREFVDNTLKSGAATRECALIRKDGRLAAVNVSSSLIRLNGRELVLSVMDDAAVLKKAERELREKNSFIDSIIENIPNMIFVKDAEDLRFVRFNKAVEELTGFSREEMLGKNDYDFFPEEEADFFTKKDRAVLESGELLDISEEKIHTKKRGVRTLHTKKIAINDEDGVPRYLLGISEDITERIQAEEELRRSLQEKESLLKEIHHRVKNNLQVISSLLSLQSDYAKGKDPSVLFQESQSRIYSIALIHEQLYQSGDLACIDMGNYIKDLTDNLKSVYGDDGRPVDVKVDSDDIAVNIDTAIPCGLIINELFSNSFKHAFKNGNGAGPVSGGLICVEFKSGREKSFTLKVKDNGRGFPQGLDFRRTETLGLQLVCTLTQQLGGNIDMEKVEGCGFSITFPSSG